MPDRSLLGRVDAPMEINVVTQLGPPFIGLILSTILFGITLLQAFIYYTVYGKQDILFHKVSVGIICTLDALHTVLTSYTMYGYLIIHAANPGGEAALSSSMKVICWPPMDRYVFTARAIDSKMLD
ncbi:hypothetical protein HWV62_12747 [Athelia sp. TMB]|nr:hypothetical protein HWV62_12747 [Athelia sp. TMB]